MEGDAGFALLEGFGYSFLGTMYSVRRTPARASRNGRFNMHSVHRVSDTMTIFHTRI